MGIIFLKRLKAKGWVKKKLNISILQYQEEFVWLREQDRIFIKMPWCCQLGLNNLMRLAGKIGDNDKIFEWDK